VRAGTSDSRPGSADIPPASSRHRAKGPPS
jgi:hypothetical protein